MGQYYKPINIDKKQWILSHDYSNGFKLMEHSWLTNNFVAVVENLIKKGGAWYGDRIVWAGDYADNEKRRKNNLYSIVGIDKNKIQPPAIERDDEFIYLVNLDKNEFVDITKIPKTTADWMGDEAWTIHPLPLLTCEGNGRGGGDYHGESPLIGRWARDRVTIQKTKPGNMIEIFFDLVE